MPFKPSAYRIVFMGSPAFAVPSLAALVQAGYNVVGVFTQRAKPAGRGHKIQPSPVQAWARAHNIPVHTPASLRKDPQAVDLLRQLQPHVIITAAYGLLLPQSVLDIPSHGCLNMHASLLPRWRGAAPMQRALLENDSQSGVTLMLMEAGLDTGPMLLQAAVPLGPTTTLSELHDQLAALNAKIIQEQLPQYLQGALLPIPQPTTGVTHAAKIEKSEGKIDWQASAAHIERKVRALSPWPGVYFPHEKTFIKVRSAQVLEGGNPQAAPPGTVLDAALLIACGKGSALRLCKVQKAGKQPLDAQAFLRGYNLKPGDILR